MEIDIKKFTAGFLVCTICGATLLPYIDVHGHKHPPHIHPLEYSVPIQGSSVAVIGTSAIYPQITGGTIKL